MLTVNQLAARLGICRQMVSRYAQQGRIPGARRFGRAWAFPDDATVTPKASVFKKLSPSGGAPQSSEPS